LQIYGLVTRAFDEDDAFKLYLQGQNGALSIAAGLQCLVFP
jgi:hypothetical protein